MCKDLGKLIPGSEFCLEWVMLSQVYTVLQESGSVATGFLASLIKTHRMGDSKSSFFMRFYTPISTPFRDGDSPSIVIAPHPQSPKASTASSTITTVAPGGEDEGHQHGAHDVTPLPGEKSAPKHQKVGFMGWFFGRWSMGLMSGKAFMWCWTCGDSVMERLTANVPVPAEWDTDATLVLAIESQTKSRAIRSHSHDLGVSRNGGTPK